VAENLGRGVRFQDVAHKLVEQELRSVQNSRVLAMPNSTCAAGKSRTASVSIAFMGSGGQFDFGSFRDPCISTFCCVELWRYIAMFFHSATAAEGCNDRYI
jgi:hypothetical protein